MAVSLSMFPQEILLEVAILSALPDAVSLLLTCRSLSSLCRERIFWISVLKTMRNKYPIACAPCTDLTLFTLEALKDLVFSWQRLQNNWSLPFPNITQPVTSSRLSGPTEILCNVQGTDILVLSTGESVFCWDWKLGIPFPLPAVDCDFIYAVSSPVYASGFCTIALSVYEHEYTARRCVITIKHIDGKAVSFVMNEVTELSIPVAVQQAFSFVTEVDVAGSIVVMNDTEECIVTVGRISRDKGLADSTTILNLHRSVSRSALIDCFAYKGHLYILLEDSLSVQIQHISRTSVRSGCCEESSRYICDKVFAAERKPFIVGACSTTPSIPFYGVSAVFVRLDGDTDNTCSSVAFTFLTNTLTHAPDDGMSSPLAFDSPTITEYVPGTLQDAAGLVWVDHGGLNLAAVVRSQPDPPRLVLVRYRPETRSTSVHTLVVPSSIDLCTLNGLCIDETAGAIHLMDREGLLSTMRYV
ncbi:hypothetical protein K438DRAFT_1943642 [Mycena galopus ATCC 62051]|nr:hypothetical protein K438DRAFT_1943642 [Mycena galopus ATCC 62051]